MTDDSEIANMVFGVFITCWILVLMLLGTGCVSDSAFKQADCLRYRYGKYNILACSDRVVG